MTILRGALPSDHYTIISNAWLRDPALSWKAKGLLAYIASHAPGHALAVEQIAAEGADGRDAIRAGLVELERRGYLLRTKLHDTSGKITGTDYTLDDPSDGKTSAGKPGAGADQAKHGVSAGRDHSGFSGAGKPAGKKTTPPTEEEKTSEKTGAASPRGRRLPEGWTPSDALLQWFVTELVPGGRWSPASRAACQQQHRVFADYWKAAAGRTAVKHDWEATWRNWMRRAFQSRSPDAPVSAPPAGGPKLFEEMREERTAQRKARSQMIDAAMDQLKAEHPEMPIGEVISTAAELVDGHLAHLKDHSQPLNTRSATGYIDGDVIDPEAPKEVTGHAA